MYDERIMLAEGKAQKALRLLTNALLYVSFSTVTGVLLKAPAGKKVLGAVLVLLAAGMSEVIQEKVSRLWLFALLHMAVAGVLCLTAPYGRTAFIFFGVFIMLLAMSSHARRVRHIHPGLFLLLYPLVIYLIALFVENEELKVFAIFLEIAVLALYLIYRNLVSMDRTYVTAGRYVRVPYGKIRKLNTAYLLCFLLGGLAVSVLLAIFTDGERFFTIVGDAVLFVMACIFYAVIWIISHLTPWVDTTAVPRDSENGRLLLDEALRNPLMKMIWNILMTVSYIILITLVLLFLFRYLKSFYREFKATRMENGDQRILLKRRERKEKSVRVRERRPGYFSNEARARRLYVKYIRSGGASDKVLPHHVPEEIERISHAREMRDPKSADKIHHIYEKIRYSGKQTESGDLQTLREETG